MIHLPAGAIEHRAASAIPTQEEHIILEFLLASYIDAQSVNHSVRLLSDEQDHWYWEAQNEMPPVSVSTGPFASKSKALTAAEEWFDVLPRA